MGKILLRFGWLALLPLMLACPSDAQNFVTVSASSIYNGGSTLLPSGTILFQAVSPAGVPISYQVGGGGQQITSPTVCSITNGVIAGNCLVANTAATNPLNVCFLVTVKDAFNNIVLGGTAASGYGCVQPAASNYWCSNSTCNFDQFIPNIGGIPTAILPLPTTDSLGGVYALQCASGLVMNGVLTTGAPSCVAGGGSGGSVAWGSITGTLSNQADLQSALNALAPLSSPALQGAPTSPTPGSTDNSTRIATTAWVQEQGYGVATGNVSGPSSSTNLDIVTFNGTTGKIIQDSGINFPIGPAHIGTLVAGLNGLAPSATTDTTNASNITSGLISNTLLSGIPNAALATPTVGVVGASGHLTSSQPTVALGGSTTIDLAEPLAASSIDATFKSLTIAGQTGGPFCVQATNGLLSITSNACGTGGGGGSYLPLTGGTLTGNLTVTVGSPSIVPLILNGAASQTALLTQWNSPSATQVGYVDASGNAGFASVATGAGSTFTICGTNPQCVAMSGGNQALMGTQSGAGAITFDTATSKFWEVLNGGSPFVSPLNYPVFGAGTHLLSATTLTSSVGVTTCTQDSSGTLGTANCIAPAPCVGANLGDFCYYNPGIPGWATFPANSSGTRYLSESSTGVLSWSSSTATANISALTNANAANSLSIGNFAQTWNCDLTSASACLNLSESAASSSSGSYLLNVTTLAGSVATPLNVANSLTGTQTFPALNVGCTWNTTGVVDACLFISVTNTASGSGSLIADFQAASNSQFEFGKGGNLSINGQVMMIGGAQTLTLAGGTGSGATNGFVGGVYVQGSDNSSANSAAVPGLAILRAGGLTASSPGSTLEGIAQVVVPYRAGTTTTAGLAMCSTTTQGTASACGTTVNGTFLGISAGAQGGTVFVVVSGEAVLTLDAALTAIGDPVCWSTTSAGSGHDNGSTAVCSTAGGQIGVIEMDSGTIKAESGNSTGSYTLSTTSVVVQLNYR